MKQSEELRSDRKSKTTLKWILPIIGIIVVIGGAGIYYHHRQQELTNYTALAPKQTKTKEIAIRSGSAASTIATTLYQKKVIRSEKAFLNYLSQHNIADLKSGYYQLSPSWNLKKIVKALENGGTDSSVDTKSTVTVREGETADDIATEVASKTGYSKKEFLAELNDADFIQKLNEEYPGLLDSAITAKDVRYRLEGYLYPATYNWKETNNVKQLIKQMVAATYTNVQPYFDKINASGMTTQQVMTLASLVEREGIDTESRQMIAGVFENRIVANISLGSDISVKYALNTTKTNLSNDDVKADSPYNLYKNKGYGPGPFNSPSLESIKAVLEPKDRDKGYLYFVANLKTGKIYYSKTYDEQLKKQSDLEDTNNAVASSVSASN